jgi:transposase
MKLYSRICSMIVIRAGYNTGQSVRTLAKVANRSESTIRRWLKTTGVRF